MNLDTIIEIRDSLLSIGVFDSCYNIWWLRINLNGRGSHFLFSIATRRWFYCDGRGTMACGLEYVLDNVSEDIQAKLLFHLDVL
jgi:hypothetical protein